MQLVDLGVKNTSSPFLSYQRLINFRPNYPTKLFWVVDDNDGDAVHRYLYKISIDDFESGKILVSDLQIAGETADGDFVPKSSFCFTTDGVAIYMVTTKKYLYSEGVYRYHAELWKYVISTNSWTRVVTLQSAQPESYQYTYFDIAMDGRNYPIIVGTNEDEVKCWYLTRTGAWAQNVLMSENVHPTHSSTILSGSTQNEFVPIVCADGNNSYAFMAKLENGWFVPPASNVEPLILQNMMHPSVAKQGAGWVVTGSINGELRSIAFTANEIESEDVIVEGWNLNGTVSTGHVYTVMTFYPPRSDGGVKMYLKSGANSWTEFEFDFVVPSGEYYLTSHRNNFVNNHVACLAYENTSNTTYLIYIADIDWQGYYVGGDNYWGKKKVSSSMVLGIDKNTGAVSEIKSAIGLLVQDSARYIDTVFVVDNSTGYNFNKEYSEPAGAGGQLEFEIVLGESNSGHQYRKLVTTMTIDFEAQVDIVATISTDDGRSKTFVLKPEKRNKPLSVNLFGRSFVVRVYEKSPYAFRLNEVTLEGQFHGSQV